MQKPERDTQSSRPGRPFATGLFARCKGLVLGAVAAVALAMSGVALAAVSDLTAGSSDVGKKIVTAAPGPSRAARAYRVDPSTAVPIFSLRNGEDVELITGPEAKCLIRRRGGEVASESCASDAGAQSGEGIEVSDECGSDSHHLMEITGIAPADATTTRLISSDGSTSAAPVVDSGFKFEGTNPASGDPYPASVEWSDSRGESLGRADLPVAGDQFCLPGA